MPHPSLLADQAPAASPRACEQLGITNAPGHLERWLLCSAAGSFHRIHVDSAGMGTFVRIIKGQKFWFVAYSLANGDRIDMWNIRNSWKKNDTAIQVVKRYRWELVVLSEGSTLYVAG